MINYCSGPVNMSRPLASPYQGTYIVCNVKFGAPFAARAVVGNRSASAGKYFEPGPL